MEAKKTARSSCWPPAALHNATYRHPILRPLRSLWFVIGLIFLILIAIGLGVGLGLGLHHGGSPGTGPGNPTIPNSPYSAAYCSDATGAYQLNNITAPSKVNTSDPTTSSSLSAAWNLTVDDTESGYKQIITGFGATVTDATVTAFNLQSNETQQALLKQLVTGEGANFNMMRHTIGSSDLSDVSYTYDDNNGEADKDLSNFALGSQGTAMAQMLAQMKELNNDLVIMGSPWSPPGWMKLNGDLLGNTTDNNLDDGYQTKQGFGNTGYSDAFAQYFVKYIQAYADLGVAIDAISIQNEPLNSQGGYPTMYVTADESAKLIMEYVGPALQNATLNTTVWGLDDNTDDYSYAQTVVTGATPYIDAIAWHCYATDLNWTVLTHFHQQYPNVSQYMTECWTPSTLNWTHTVNFTMGPLQNWANGVAAWTLGTNEDAGPYLASGGCDSCDGLVSVNSTSNTTSGVSQSTMDSTTYTFSTSYYLMAQFSKFIPPGARILQANGSSTDDNGFGIQTVASLNPSGTKSVVIENTFNNAVNVTVELVSGDLWMGSVPATSLTTWILP